MSLLMLLCCTKIHGRQVLLQNKYGYSYLCLSLGPKHIAWWYNAWLWYHVHLVYYWLAQKSDNISSLLFRSPQSHPSKYCPHSQHEHWSPPGALWRQNSPNCYLVHMHKQQLEFSFLRLKSSWCQLSCPLGKTSTSTYGLALLWGLRSSSDQNVGYWSPHCVWM